MEKRKFDLGYVKRLTMLDDEKRRSLMAYFARLPEPERIEAIKLQTDLIRQHRKNGYDKKSLNEFNYAMLLLALAKMKWIEGGQARKGDLSDAEHARVTEIRVRRIKTDRKARTAKMRRMIEFHFWEIHRFRDQSNPETFMSWRQISGYFGKHHKKRISHNYLRECYAEVLEAKTMRGKSNE